MSSDSWIKIQYWEFKCSMPHANGISKQYYECCRSEANCLPHHIIVEVLHYIIYNDTSDSLGTVEKEGDRKKEYD